MGFEAVVLIVLQDEPTAWLQQFFLKNQIWQRINGGQGVRRACKNIIESSGCPFDEFEYVGEGDFYKILYIKLFGCFLYEFHAGGKVVHVRDILAAPRYEFIAVAAGASEKVEYLNCFKVEVIVQNVEQSFFGKIGGRAGWPFVCRRVKAASFEFTGNDSHEMYCLAARYNGVYLQRAREKTSKKK